MELEEIEYLDSLPKEVKEIIKSKLTWIKEAEKTPAELLPTKKIFCNNCKGETNHICKYHDCKYSLASGKNFEDKDIIVLYTLGSCIWICAGCDDSLFEKYLDFDYPFYPLSEVEYDEEDEHTDLASDRFSNEFYPKRTHNDLTSKDYSQLPESLNKIYREVIKAFNYEIFMLCAIGIRSLIEGICFDQEITGRTLEKKIEGLVSILPKNIVENLHNLRFMGNEAAHELSAPSSEELKLAIEICEDLLNYLYELDYKASYLNKIRKQQSLGGNSSAFSFKFWHK